MYTLVKHPFHKEADGDHYEHCMSVQKVGILGQAKVRRAGGLLLDSEGEAKQFAQRENYGAQRERNKNDSLESMISRGVNMFDGQAPGTFSSVRVSGLPVYLPSFGK